MFILVCAVLLLCPERAALGAVNGIRIAWENVIASILPFLIFAEALIYTGACERWAKGLKPLFRFLGINKKSIVPFVVSLLAGYPSGGKIVCDMYKDSTISKREAESFLAFCNNGGVVFAVGVIGGSFFNSYITGVIVFVSQIVASLITGAIFAKGGTEEGDFREIKKIPQLSALGKSIASCGQIIGNILAAFIVFHALISALSLDRFPFVCGLLELTRGIMQAGEMGNAPLAAFFFAFGSLSVMAQVASFSGECEISLKKYFFGKLLTGVICAIVTFCILEIAGKI